MNSGSAPKGYIDEVQSLYNYYRPIEIDEELEFIKKEKLVREWFKKHIDLFVKYKVNEDIFKNVAKNSKGIELRDGFKDFVYFLYKNNIPLIIISAGIGNFIENFLRYNECYLDNVYIISNKIKFNNGIASGTYKNIIHSLNKNEVSLPKKLSKNILSRNNVILLGDQISDLDMVNDNSHDTVYKICLLTEETIKHSRIMKNKFDIVCEDNNNYHDIIDVIFKR